MFSSIPRFIFTSLIFAMLLESDPALAQPERDSPRQSSSLDAQSPQVTAAPELAAPHVQGSFITGVTAPITITVQISDSRLIPNSVFAQRLDYTETQVQTLGILRDDGAGADKVANDGIFSGVFPMAETDHGMVPLRVSAAFKGFLKRILSPTVTMSVEPNGTTKNAEGDLSAFNLGDGGIQLNLGGSLPEGTTEVRLLRAQSVNGPWVMVWELPSEGLMLPLYDSIDGRMSDFYHRLEALAPDGSILKSYSPVFVPRYRLPTEDEEFENSPSNLVPSTSNAANDYSAAIAAPYNSAFITDDIIEDANAMTVYQIRDLLEDKKSSLKTDRVEDTVSDTDGAQFSPAQTIYNIAQKYAINPQLLLVSMQKESQLITAPAPSPGPDGFMGVKDCVDQTIRGQIDCAGATFRQYLNELDTTGVTVGGWRVGVPKKTCYPDPGSAKVPK
jgi:hypothetical protein